MSFLVNIFVKYLYIDITLYNFFSTSRQCNVISEQVTEDSQDKQKQYIKLTTCPACMERWKTPLPIPKIPKIKKTKTSDSTVIKTNSRNRINVLIEQELYKLNSYDRRYSNDSQTSRKSSINKQVAVIASTENLKMSPLEIAKIEQEIKEKETQKKLEKFLRESFDNSK